MQNIRSTRPVCAALILGLALLSHGAHADWTQARCEISSSAAAESTRVTPCVFSQRQGYINVDGEGVSLDLQPVGDAPGEFRDQLGRTVLRSIPEDGNSQLFETEGGLVRVVWTALSARAAPGSGRSFDETLVYQGVSFRVATPNVSSINPVTIGIAGLELGPATLEREADGVVTGAEVADLNGDGSPELYIYTSSAGSGSYGNLIAFSVNDRKSASDIFLPPLDDSRGYMGHDEFAVVERVLARRYPLYREGDTNAGPTGGTRQVQYRLVPGEAGWLLQPDKVIDY
jgi:hypothetical protein